MNAAFHPTYWLNGQGITSVSRSGSAVCQSTSAARTRAHRLGSSMDSETRACWMSIETNYEEETE